jgi:hypothetical protein
MRAILRLHNAALFGVYCVLPVGLYAQMYAQGTYLNESNDGANVYATAVLDYYGQPGMYSYNHTYNVYVSIGSPGGRGNSNYQSAYATADQTMSVTAQTQLTLDWSDLGSYNVNSTFNAQCSAIGTVVNAAKPDVIGFGVSATNYKYGGLGPDIGDYVYNIDCDASNTDGGQVTCTNSPIVDSAYGDYYQQQYGSIIYSNGSRVCVRESFIPPNYYSGAQNVRGRCN